MKILKRIIICIIISLIIQCTILFYFDKILFKESNEFTVENIATVIDDEAPSICIPNDAQDIKGSFNGDFITYFENEELKIVNTLTGEVKEILNDIKILNIEWVPKSNTLFLVENNQGKINVKTYNAENETEQDVCELCDYKEDIKVQSFISLSTEYLSITNKERTTVYRIDIEKEVKKVSKSKLLMGSASVSQNKDIFYFEDLDKNEFYQYSNGEIKQLNLDDMEKLVIVKAIGNTLYIGKCSDSGKVSQILYESPEVNFKEWKSQMLPEEADKNDIYISSNNQIYINNNAKGNVINITTGENIKYDGKFLFMNDKVICNLNNNYLNFISLDN